MSNFTRNTVKITTANDRYAHMRDGLSMSDVKQAQASLQSFEAQEKAKNKDEATQRLMIDSARTGINLLKTNRDPKAKELVAFLEKTGLDNNSLHLANQFVQQHLANDAKTAYAMSFFQDADRINTHGVSETTTTDHSNYHRISTQVDPMTGHKTFIHSTNREGNVESSAFATQRNAKLDSMMSRYDIIEE